MGPVLIILAIVSVMIFVAWYVWYLEKQRREALRQLAQELGLSYTAADSHGYPSRFQHLNGYNSGHSRNAYNILSGEYRKHAVVALHYLYKTTETYIYSKGHVRTRTVTHQFSSVVLELAARFPAEVFVRPEGFLDRLAGWVGFDDIDFESDEFSRKFYVKSTDRRLAYDIFHPRMMEYLLKTPPYQIELDQSNVHFRRGDRFTPAEFREALDRAIDFVALFPDYLVQQLSAAAR